MTGRQTTAAPRHPREQACRAQRQQASAAHHALTSLVFIFHSAALSEPLLCRVLLVHATGYHARLWDGVIDAMPRSVRCVAIDQRGHGASDKPAPSSKPWTDSWCAFCSFLLEPAGEE